MNDNASQQRPQSQLDKFKELARKVEADEDEAAWDERLKKVAGHKPAQDVQKDK